MVFHEKDTSLESWKGKCVCCSRSPQTSHEACSITLHFSGSTGLAKVEVVMPVVNAVPVSRLENDTLIVTVPSPTCPSHVFAPWPQQIASCFCAKAIWWHAELSFLKWLEKDIRNNKNVSLVVSSDRRWIVSWQATDCLVTGDGLSHDMRHAFSATNK